MDLINAILTEDVKIVARALRACAEDINRPRDGYTPLDVAACHDNVELVQLLYWHGADINQKTNGGSAKWIGKMMRKRGVRTHLFVEKSRLNPETLNRAREEMTALHCACYFGAARATKLLIELNADPSAKRKVGATPLHSAILQDELECLKVLLSVGAQPERSGCVFNREDNNPLEISAFHFAAKSRKGGKCLKYLLKHFPQMDADEQPKSFGKLSPLHVAIQNGNYEALEVLLLHGAEINVKDQYGNSPENLVMLKNEKEISEVWSKFARMNIQTDRKRKIVCDHDNSIGDSVHDLKRLKTEHTSEHSIQPTKQPTKSVPLPLPEIPMKLQIANYQRSESVPMQLPGVPMQLPVVPMQLPGVPNVFQLPEEQKGFTNRRSPAGTPPTQSFQLPEEQKSSTNRRSPFGTPPTIFQLPGEQKSYTNHRSPVGTPPTFQTPPKKSSSVKLAKRENDKTLIQSFYGPNVLQFDLHENQDNSFPTVPWYLHPSPFNPLPPMPLPSARPTPSPIPAISRNDQYMKKMWLLGKKRRVFCRHCLTDKLVKPTERQNGRLVLNHVCSSLPRRQYVIGVKHRKCEIDHQYGCIELFDDLYE